jgi:hypothetical protein
MKEDCCPSFACPDPHLKSASNHHISLFFVQVSSHHALQTLATLSKQFKRFALMA